MARGCYARRPPAERIKLKESALAMVAAGVKTVDAAQALGVPRPTLNTWLRAAGIPSAGKPRREPVERQPRHLTSAFTRADALLQWLRDEADEYVRTSWMNGLRARTAWLQGGGKASPVPAGASSGGSTVECPSSRPAGGLATIHA